MYSYLIVVKIKLLCLNGPAETVGQVYKDVVKSFIESDMPMQ